MDMKNAIYSFQIKMKPSILPSIPQPLSPKQGERGVKSCRVGRKKAHPTFTLSLVICPWLGNTIISMPPNLLEVQQEQMVRRNDTQCLVKDID